MSYGKPRELPPVSAQHSQLPLCRVVLMPYTNQLLWHQPLEPIRGADWNGDWDMKLHYSIPWDAESKTLFHRESSGVKVTLLC